MVFAHFELNRPGRKRKAGFLPLIAAVVLLMHVIRFERRSPNCSEYISRAACYRVGVFYRSVCLDPYGIAVAVRFLGESVKTAANLVA